MKKTLLALLFCAIACTKAETEQTISIRITGVASGTIPTKAVSDALSQTAPSGTPTLTLTSADGIHTYTATPNTPLSVRLGTYAVTGEYVVRANSSIPSFGFAYPEPRYRINTAIEVTEGSTEYSVGANYDCYALLIDYTATEKYASTTNSATDFSDVACFTRIGDYGVAYIWSGGASARGACTLRVTPIDKETYDDTDFDLYWQGNRDGVKVENGKWYLFSAGSAPRESGDFGVTLPEWEAGN